MISYTPSSVRSCFDLYSICVPSFLTTTFASSVHSKDTEPFVYPPFSTGTESLYGVRPQAGLDGVFGYEYNMAAAAGMLVREGETVYECTRDIDPMLWPPSQLPGHFKIR